GTRVIKFWQRNIAPPCPTSPRTACQQYKSSSCRESSEKRIAMSTFGAVQLGVRVNFSLDSEKIPYICSLERKSGTVVRTYRTRTVCIDDGKLQFYTPKGKGLDMDPAYLLSSDELVGAGVFRKDDSSETHVTIRGTKDSIKTRSKNHLEAEDFEREVRKEVTRANSLALAAGARDPEIVDWYYHCQDGILKRSGRLREVPQGVAMSYSIPGQGDRVAHFKLTVSERQRRKEAEK
ncbi:hypothetical protein B484DRAFT_271664, partial [Ochromonadaceae sp. CCMP2298]